MEGMETCPCVTALYLASNRCPPDSPSEALTMRVAMSGHHIRARLPPHTSLASTSGLPVECSCQLPQVGAFLFGLENLRRSSAGAASMGWLTGGKYLGLPTSQSSLQRPRHQSSLLSPQLFVSKKVPWSSCQSLLRHL